MAKPSSFTTAASATHELKQRVFSCLEKLSDRATLSQANAELESIARALSADSLSPFLSCCLSVDSNHKSPVRSHSIRLLCLLAATHTNALSPHLPKILSSILRRLRDSDSAVRSACVDAVSSLSRHLTSSPFSSFLDPLLSALFIEQDYNVQIGSALCLSAAIASSPNLEVTEVRKMVPKLMKLTKAECFKAKSALLGLIGSVVEVNAGGVVNGSKGLMGSVVGSVVEMLSSEDWAARKAAAEVLEKVALIAERDIAAELKKFCVDSLENRRFDKVKIARETMNRALEAWKEVPNGGASATSGEESSLSRHSSISKGLGPDAPTGGHSPLVAKTSNNLRLEAPKQKKAVSRSRSSLSDESTVTFSPPSSKSSPRIDAETPQSEKKMTKSRSSLSDRPARVNVKRSLVKHPDKRPSIPLSRKVSDWKIEIAVPRGPPSRVVSEEDLEDRFPDMGFSSSVENDASDHSASETTHSFSENCEERVSNFNCFEEDGGSRAVVDTDRRPVQEMYDNSLEFEGLTLIRDQLVQIERQQSNLLDLLQRFMGTSQNGLSSLETRVAGLERALDEMSYDLAVQSGRYSKNSSAGNTCCMLPSADFLSPKFWKKTDGRCSATKSCCSGAEAAVEMNGDRLQQQAESMKQFSNVCRESWRNTDISSARSAKSAPQNAQRVRACSAGSIDEASPRTRMAPAVHGS